MVRPKKLPTRKHTRTAERATLCINRKVFHLSKKILNEICKAQNTTKLLIPKLPFARLVREIIQSMAGMDYRIQATALSALHEAAEVYVIGFLEDSNLSASHAGRVTLMAKDMAFINTLRSRYGPYM